MISKAELDQSEAQLAMAQAAHGASRSSLGAVSTRLSETRLGAPFPGWVSRRHPHPRAVVLPVEAVIAEEKERSVFVVTDIHEKTGVARRLPVEVGFDGGDWLEIVKGLSGAEEVVIAGMDLAGDGAPVSISRKDKT